MNSEMILFSGNANPDLARKMVSCLGIKLGDSKVSRFSDGEIRVEIDCNVRGRDVFLVQPTCAPTNDNLMELLIMSEACKRSSAGRITAVIPYFGYARQDRKVASRAPITARLVADLIQAAGINRVLTMDLHAAQIQGFFNIPVDNLYAEGPIVNYFQSNLSGKDLVVVSPDAGGARRARSMSQHLGASLAIVDKRRSGPNEAEVMHLVGDVKGKTAILLDDMIDTAGTLTKGGQAVLAAGASTVYAAASHAVFSGPAHHRLAESVFAEIVVTDTIPRQEGCPHHVRHLTVAPLFAEAVRAVHYNDSVSRLFLD